MNSLIDTLITKHFYKDRNHTFLKFVFYFLKYGYMNERIVLTCTLSISCLGILLLKRLVIIQCKHILRINVSFYV